MQIQEILMLLHFFVDVHKTGLAYPRLPPTAVRMNHERLPRHCVYRGTSSMTSQSQIWHILNIASSFSATLFSPNLQ
jgi:hypothetical protein